MDWMEITVLTTTEGAEMVSEILLNAGSAGTMIEDKNDIAANQRPEGRWDILDASLAEKIGDDVRVTGYYPADAHLEEVVAEIDEGIRRLRMSAVGVPLGKLERLQKGFENEDWAQSWKKAYKAVRIGAHFVIKPSWMEYDALPGDKMIEIDPGMAFGTGTHETTGMCAEMIERYVRPGQRVIDIGTGSGVLAIAAAHMGAGQVLATDLDPVAVRVAKENAGINGFGHVIEARCGDLLEVVDVSGDVVIANIIADVIVMLAAPVREHIVSGGIFICSGIAAQRRDEVLQALKAAGYEILEQPVRGEWAAFAARRR